MERNTCVTTQPCIEALVSKRANRIKKSSPTSLTMRRPTPASPKSCISYRPGVSGKVVFADTVKMDSSLHCP